MNSYYLTTAISYTNGIPHIGHAYEAIIGDIIARYKKLEGKEVYYMTGADEHGQKIMKTAEEKGITPKELCDQNVEKFKELYRDLNIEYNRFIRTSDNYHYKTAQTVFQKCFDKGDIYLGDYIGWYSQREERFITELEAKSSEYKDPISNTPYQKISESSYFFKLEKYREQIKTYLNTQLKILPVSSIIEEILNRLESPLQDLSITRTSFNWGIPINIPKGENHVMYVWFDALTNYLSGLNFFDNSPLSSYWPPVHLIGRDILWFHIVIWPAILLSCDISLPNNIIVHGMITDSNGIKMSKSIGNVVDPFTLLLKYSSDQIRYYLIRAGSFGFDIKFSYSQLEDISDSDLANLYGNLVSRSFTLLSKKYNSILPDISLSSPYYSSSFLSEISTLLSSYRLDLILDKLVLYLQDINLWLYNTAPWSLSSSLDRDLIIKELFERLFFITHLLHPFIPNSTTIVFSRFNISPISFSSFTLNNLPNNHFIDSSPIKLFPKFRIRQF